LAEIILATQRIGLAQFLARVQIRHTGDGVEDGSRVACALRRRRRVGVRHKDENDPKPDEEQDQISHDERLINTIEP
jgi:hypothetical protein